MVYIITSKTRRVRPNGKVMVRENRETGESRIGDERYLESRLKHQDWTDPAHIPGYKQPE